MGDRTPFSSYGRDGLALHPTCFLTWGNVGRGINKPQKHSEGDRVQVPGRFPRAMTYLSCSARAPLGAQSLDMVKPQ